MKQFNRSKGIKRYQTLMMKCREILKDADLQKKEEIFAFFKKHKNLAATLDFAKISKSTFYNWKKVLKENNNNILSLKKKSTRPKNFREAKHPKELIKKIIELRKNYGKIGKQKIYHLLENNENITFSIPSISTIGRIITKLKKQNKIDVPENKVSINGVNGTIFFGKTRRKQGKRKIDKDFSKAKEKGHFQIDTIVEIKNNTRRYIIQAVDVWTRFVFSYAYKNASSRCAKDFLLKLIEVLPYKIKKIQTDNGSEFEKDFKKYCDEQDSKIPIYKTYPRSPKMNAKVERFNRTTQEEFLNFNKDLFFEDIESFNQKLMKWVFWFNTERPHFSLDFLSPLKFYIQNILNKKSDMYWTCTQS